MSVTFQKMHGAGNDFVLLDLRRQACELDPDRARALANRRTGIGCDQILVLRNPATEGPLARFEVWNSDGSTAEQCGNGVRCIGLYLERLGETRGRPFSLEGPAGTIHGQCQENGQVRMNMGIPEFNPSLVPVNLAPDNGLYFLPEVSGGIHFGAVSMGNPHAVIPTPDLEQADVAAVGAAISAHPAFPEGCNVGFVQRIDRGNIRLRVFERGSAETLACGSGACAAMAVLYAMKETDSQVSVIQTGGELIIDWDGGNEPLYMTGPAVHVFEGIM